jgi:hypothetical protein
LCTTRRVPWRSLYKGDLGVRLSNQWYCSVHCFELAAATEVERLLEARPGAPRSHRLPLGLLLLERGQVTTAQLRTALQRQREAGRGRIGEWLIAMGFVGEEQIVLALAQQWACPVLRLPPATAFPQNLDVPHQLLRSFRVYPIRFMEPSRTLYLAVCEQINHSLLQALGLMLECQIAPGLISSRAMDALLASYRPGPAHSGVGFDGYRQPAEIARITASYVGHLGAEAVRVARCDQMLWVHLQAERQSTHLLFGPSLPATRCCPSSSKSSGVKPSENLPMFQKTARPDPCFAPRAAIDVVRVS